MNIIEFKNSKELESQLAIQIAAKIDLTIKKNNCAKLLVSGGTSPIGMFHLLSIKQIDWENVTVGLVDERFVSVENVASNERLVKENLLINEAQKATFISMIYDCENETNNLELANNHYTIFYESVDVCVLGMGDDGHTASLFPNDKSSINSLMNETVNLISTRSPNEPQRRISCSKQLILNSDNIYVMFMGENKKIVLQQASAKKLPISFITESENKVVDIYYSEKK